jgi:hypothetical protein
MRRQHFPRRAHPPASVLLVVEVWLRLDLFRVRLEAKPTQGLAIIKFCGNDPGQPANQDMDVGLTRQIEITGLEQIL